MSTKLRCLTLLLLVVVANVDSASILFYTGLSTYSHRVVLWPLVERLAASGHDVTFLSGYLPKKPNKNVTEFAPKALRDYMSSTFGTESNIVQLRLEGQHMSIWKSLHDMGLQVCKVLMADEEYLDLVKNKKFDLVVLDFAVNDCAFGLIHYQKAKHIVFDTTHPIQWQYDMYGFSPESSWIPDLAYGYQLPMSFVDRFINTLRPIMYYNNRVNDYYPKLEAMINEGLGLSGENALDIRALEKNVSLVFTNTHYSLEQSRPLPPLYVPVGGLHIVEGNQELPQDMKKFADESGPDGFIYISFGSGVQISKAKPELQRVFFNSLSKFKTRFIWKWESERPAEMPPNVFTAKWMPQKDVLAHPNIKGFITHAGLMGIEEAVVHAVPLIAFPFFAEQDYNAERIQREGYGIRLEISTLTEKDLTDAIHAILTNPSYKEKMKDVSTFFTDRQVDPLETAVWWVEFVLRNKQNPFILPLGAHQPWYIRRNLDVWGTIIGSIFFVAGLLVGCMLRTGSKGQKVKTN